MKKIKIICSDIDGTLLKDNHLNLDLFSSSTLKSIKEFTEKESQLLILATGRALYRTRKIANYLEKKLNKNCVPYLISLNGAVIFDNIKKKVIQNLFYQEEIKNEICEYLEKEKLHYFLVNKHSLLHCKKNLFSFFIKNTWFFRYTKTTLYNHTHVDDVQKILIFTKNGDTKLHKTAIEAAFPNVYVSCFGECVMEIIDKKINKFFALEKVAELMKTNVSEILSIGNEGNDLMMIENSGMGVAVDFYKSPHLKFDKNKVDFFTANTDGKAFYWTYQYLKNMKFI